MSEIIQQTNIHQYQNIIAELSKCDKNQTIDLIIQLIIDNKSLLDIAIEYLRISKYSGFCNESTCCGLFDAFINYKTNKNFNYFDALYLSSRSGIIGQYQDINNSNKFKTVSVRYLIREMDGIAFFEWMEKLATYAEKEYEIYENDMANEENKINYDQDDNAYYNYYKNQIF